MSVSDGQIADEDTFNNAFPSRQNDSTLSGEYEFNNGSAVSGPTITNAQAKMNNASTGVVSTLTIAAAGAISINETIGNLVLPVVGDAAPQDASLTPFGATGNGSGGNAWVNGTRIKLIGTNDTNTVTYKNNDVIYGAILNGDAKLGKYSSLDLVWVLALGRWIETGRSV